LTCYTHLECLRGPSSLCLDWTEISDRKIDGLNDGLDEKYCCQTEINECSHNEYRCLNEQCITLTFCLDKDNHFDKLDEYNFE
jgi:hypothetical protein